MGFDTNRPARNYHTQYASWDAKHEPEENCGTGVTHHASSRGTAEAQPIQVQGENSSESQEVAPLDKVMNAMTETLRPSKAPLPSNVLLFPTEEKRVHMKN